MRRSTIARAVLAALLVQLLPPAGVFAEPGRTRLDTHPSTTDKQPPQPRRGPIQRSTINKESPRPEPRPIPRADESDVRPGPGNGRIQRFDYEAPNGFRIDVRAWPARRGGYTAAATLASPSGERMTFELSPDAGYGPTVLVDGAIVVSYDTGRHGRLRKLTVHDGERAVTSFHTRAGHPNRSDAYLHLAEAVASRHSAEFLGEMKVALQALHHDAVAPANLRDILECTLGVTGYIVSVWGIIAGCVVAGVPTLGASCIFAIFAHEVAVASAILACFPD